MIALQQQGINPKALSWTVGVHILLLLLFIFWRYTLPVVVTAPEMGMEVNLGTNDNGSGTDQPMDVEDPAMEAFAARRSRASQSGMKDIMTAENADAPGIRASNSKKKDISDQDADKLRKSREQANDRNAHAQPQAKYVYTGSNGKGGNGAMQHVAGTSEGNTTGSSDRGVPNGTPGSANYTGSPGNGTGGISHNLSGREIIAFPPPDAEFKEQGRVTIRITVNRAGWIINKQIISSSSADLNAIALHKAEKVRFNKSETSPEEQFGSITFVFKTRS